MRLAYVCADPGVPVFGAKGASVHVQGVLGALLRARADVERIRTAARKQRKREGAMASVAAEGLAKYTGRIAQASASSERILDLLDGSRRSPTPRMRSTSRRCAASWRSST